MNVNYENQVKLLVRCIPEIAEQDCFALKGGTAINLFYRNLPRLSVDIDLAYVYNKPRIEAFEEINESLMTVSENLKKHGISTIIQSKNGINKIIAFDKISAVKIEPNYLNRGICFPLERLATCDEVQKRFGFAEINVLSKPEVFGGKICAALDRQHPRDLFDVSLMLRNNEIDETVKDGFIIELMSHNRNVYGLLNPNMKDQEDIFKSQFSQMTTAEFSYSNHIDTFGKLVSFINQKITSDDRKNIIDIISLNVPIEKTRFSFAKDLPAIKWKLRNLEILKFKQPDKFNELVEITNETFSKIEQKKLDKRKQSQSEDV